MSGKHFKSAVFFLVILQFVFIFSQATFSQTKRQKIKEADYCKLIGDKLRDGSSEIVKTRVLLNYSTVESFHGSDFFYSSQCNSADYFASENSSNTNNPWDKWQSRFSNLPKDKDFVFEIILTGRIHTSIIPSYGDISWSRNEVEVLMIESIRDVTATAAAPDREAEALMKELGRSLKAVNETVLFYFNNTSYVSGNLDDVISDDFVVTDISGKSYDKKTYRELAQNGLFKINGELKGSGIAGWLAESFQNDYKVSGKVFIEYKNGQRQELKYENVYRLQNKLWMLAKTTFSKP